MRRLETLEKRLAAVEGNNKLNTIADDDKDTTGSSSGGALRGGSNADNKERKLNYYDYSAEIDELRGYVMCLTSAEYYVHEGELIMEFPRDHHCDGHSKKLGFVAGPPGPHGPPVSPKQG